MEVHHHPHVEKKSFKEYLLEGLMIFVAVTMGYIAENVRENITDNHKEREYMISMLSDLEKDTLSLDQAVAINKLLILGTDSTINYLSRASNNEENAKLGLMYFFKYCQNVRAFLSADGTITQLKNNGGLQLIKDKEVINKINIYYRDNLRLQGTENSVREFSNTNNKKAGEVFNYMSNKNLIDSANLCKEYNYDLPLSRLQSWAKSSGPILLTKDAKVLSPFLNNLNATMGFMIGYSGTMESQKQSAKDLIKTIKENYSIKNE